MEFVSLSASYRRHIDSGRLDIKALYQHGGFSHRDSIYKQAVKKKGQKKQIICVKLRKMQRGTAPSSISQFVTRHINELQ